jgi:hypothetical protein
MNPEFGADGSGFQGFFQKIDLKEAETLLEELAA